METSKKRRSRTSKKRGSRKTSGLGKRFHKLADPTAAGAAIGSAAGPVGIVVVGVVGYIYGAAKAGVWA